MGKDRKNPVTDEQIIEGYKRLLSVYKLSKEVGVAETTIYRILIKNGIERIGLGHYRKSAAKFTGERAKEIAELYKAGAKVNELSKRFGCTDHAIRSAVKRAGGELRPNPIPTLSDEEMAKIMEMHAQGVSQMKISLALGRSQSIVSRFLRRCGYEHKARSGEKSASWKGGRMVNKEGYVSIKLEHDDPLFCMADSSHYVREHRLVMARHLSRPL
jgi:transposase